MWSAAAEATKEPTHAATEHAARRCNYKRTARPDAQIKENIFLQMVDYLTYGMVSTVFAQNSEVK